jgi:hypothetical protein
LSTVKAGVTVATSEPAGGIVVRSLLAFGAAAFFLYNAIGFLPVSGAYLNDGAFGGVDGDSGAVAVVWAARTLFAGMTLISLALVEWERILPLFQRSGKGEEPPQSSASR